MKLATAPFRPKETLLYLVAISLTVQIATGFDGLYPRSWPLRTWEALLVDIRDGSVLAAILATAVAAAYGAVNSPVSVISGPHSARGAAIRIGRPIAVLSVATICGALIGFAPQIISTARSAPYGSLDLLGFLTVIISWPLWVFIGYLIGLLVKNSWAPVVGVVAALLVLTVPMISRQDPLTGDIFTLRSVGPHWGLAFPDVTWPLNDAVSASRVILFAATLVLLGALCIQVAQGFRRGSFTRIMIGGTALITSVTITVALLTKQPDLVVPDRLASASKCIDVAPKLEICVPRVHEEAYSSLAEIHDRLTQFVPEESDPRTVILSQLPPENAKWPVDNAAAALFPSPDFGSEDHFRSDLTVALAAMYTGEIECRNQAVPILDLGEGHDPAQRQYALVESIVARVDGMEDHTEWSRFSDTEFHQWVNDNRDTIMECRL